MILQGGRIFDTEGNLQPNSDSVQVGTRETTDEFEIVHLSDTAVIFAGGLVDYHLHLQGEADAIGVDEREILQSGVLSVGDAGTYGWQNWEQRGETQIVRSRGWVSLVAEGLTHHPEVPVFTGLDDAAVARLLQLFADKTGISRPVGLKIRLGQHDVQEDERLLAEGVRHSRELQVPLMVHLTGTFLPLREVVGALTCGDVLTHIYHGRRGNILHQGKLASAMGDAVAKGVVLDVGHGKNHFSWHVFRTALREGLLPTTVSTDLTRNTWNSAPVYNLPYVISKLLAAGMSWSEVYKDVVQNPSQLLNLERRNDGVTVLDFHEHAEAFADAEGATVAGTGTWRPVLVVAGALVLKNHVE